MTVLRETQIFPSSVLFLVLKTISYNRPPTPRHSLSLPNPLGVPGLSGPVATEPSGKNFKTFKTLRRRAQYGASHMNLMGRAPRPGAVRQALYGLPASPLSQLALPSPRLDPLNPQE